MKKALLIIIGFSSINAMEKSAQIPNPINKKYAEQSTTPAATATSAIISKPEDKPKKTRNRTESLFNRFMDKLNCLDERIDNLEKRITQFHAIENHLTQLRQQMQHDAQVIVQVTNTQAKRSSVMEGSINAIHQTLAQMHSAWQNHEARLKLAESTIIQQQEKIARQQELLAYYRFHGFEQFNNTITPKSTSKK